MGAGALRAREATLDCAKSYCHTRRILAGNGCDIVGVRSMSPEDFVARLDRVRQTGNARWTARCPAHEDKNPSLSVAMGDDGRVLVRCFAECSIVDIAAGAGVTVADLMPERLANDRYRPIRKPFPAADVIEMLKTELLIVQLCAWDIGNGKEIDRERLAVAADRIGAAIG